MSLERQANSFLELDHLSDYQTEANYENSENESHTVSIYGFYFNFLSTSKLLCIDSV